jgi:diketogulonate reductase-like aldo/keto reductase
VGVGKAIAASGRARETLFITTKIPGGLNFKDATKAMDQNLDQLGSARIQLDMHTHQ